MTLLKLTCFVALTICLISAHGAVRVARSPQFGGGSFSQASSQAQAGGGFGVQHPAIFPPRPHIFGGGPGFGGGGPGFGGSGPGLGGGPGFGPGFGGSGPSISISKSISIGGGGGGAQSSAQSGAGGK